MNRRELRDRILAHVPWDRFVSAGDVVSTLADLPSKRVWGEIVVLAMEGVITTANPGKYDGQAMIRRIA